MCMTHIMPLRDLCMANYQFAMHTLMDSVTAVHDESMAEDIAGIL